MKVFKITVCFWVFLLFACQRKNLPVIVQPSNPSLSVAIATKKDTLPAQVKPTQIAVPLDSDRFYKQAYSELSQMLSGRIPLDFKRAVFVTENAYYDNKLNYEDFSGQISALTVFAGKVSQSKKLVYNYSDSLKIQKMAAAFSMMKDTFVVIDSTNHFRVILPYSYDFDDFTASKDWSKMFVTKLLKYHSGNCHSLPFLYKIVVEEMGETAHLALAPNHIYLKLYSQKDGWYNTELTSGSFPIDAWLMASGYIHLSAIQNGIYMDTLSLRQSVALCVVDLAQGYKRKFGNDSAGFVLQCCNLALQHFPVYINALILKAETEKNVFESYMKVNHIIYPKDALSNTSARNLYDDFEKLYAKIYELGYRKIPDEMYAQWLSELNVEKEMYNNRKISTFK